ncbi:hypothetical protein [Helicobacter sp. T3_23-1056]
MKIALFVLLICFSVVSAGKINNPKFDDMLKGDMSYFGALQKSHTENTKIIYKGEITLNGVLEWHKYQDEVDMYWRLIFFPDNPKALPRLSSYDNQFGIVIMDTLQKNIEFQKSSFLQLKNILKNKVDKNDEYIFGGIAVRVNITLQNYFIETNLDSDSDSRYFANIKSNSVKTLGDIRKWYISTIELPSEYMLSYASKDSYINLRESPKGRVLNQILKDSIHTRCANDFNDLTKGFIIFLGKDFANPKWYKIAYIPPNAKDTSKAIYGVIHNSQVGFECE